jgi:photosystem II stability/assembly factor-like uncharacterized protein
MPTPFARTVRLAALAFAITACTSHDGGSSGDGPQIISLGTNVTELTMGQSVQFVAQVTHPKGVANLLGGELRSPDGAITYGVFDASQPGSYAHALTWDQLDQAKTITFASEEQRPIVATFFDAAGNQTSQTVTLRLHCGGQGALAGVCTAEGASCGAGMVFAMGACSAGCYVGGALRLPDLVNPANACQSCQPLAAPAAWSSRPDVTPCGGGSFCYAGACATVFRSLTSGTTDFALAAWGASADEVFLLGGRVLHTTNGGTTWAVQDPGKAVSTPVAFYGLWGTAATNLFVVGDHGSIVHTVDGGATWVAQTIGTTARLYAVWGPDANTVFVSGDDGTIWRTFDRGANWTKAATLAIPVGALWGSKLGDIYGTNGTRIVHSSDGGVTWAPQILPAVNGQLIRLWGADALNVFAVGDGTILHTSDGGTTWKLQTSGFAGRLSGVWGTSPTDVFAVGASGTILRTSDGGGTWTRQPSPSADTLYAVWASSPTNVFITGGQGVTPTPIFTNR